MKKVSGNDISRMFLALFIPMKLKLKKKKFCRCFHLDFFGHSSAKFDLQELNSLSEYFLREFKF